MRIEATHYIETLDYLSKIPYLGRQGTMEFVDHLYKFGAVSVEVSNVQNAQHGTNFIMEIYIRVPDEEKVRRVLTDVLTTYPIELEETRKRVFRVRWDFKHLHKQVLRNGYPPFSHNLSND